MLNFFTSVKHQTYLAITPPSILSNNSKRQKLFGFLALLFVILQRLLLKSAATLLFLQNVQLALFSKD